MEHHVALRDGHRLPILGFGLYKVPASQAEDVVTEGLAFGYRLVDSAEFYANEAQAGRGLARSGVERDDITVTSKFWGEESQAPEAVRAAFDASERALGRIDLYLIHWPRPSRNQYVDVWRTLIELRDAGRVRSIGVANFSAEHITRLGEETGELPVLNQIELHPYLQQAELRDFHAEHGIVTQAWSPLGRGHLLSDPTIVAIAGAHGVSPAQVVIRWHLQLGTAAVPKSVNAERLRSNADVFSFDLTAAEMAAIGELERGQHFGTAPTDRQ